MFMSGVVFCRQKLRPRPKSDMTLGIGLEVLQISWQVILMNLFWYYVTVILSITFRDSAAVCLHMSVRKSYLFLNIFSLNPEDRSSAYFSSSNFCFRGFLNSRLRVWCFRLCCIRLDFPLRGGCFPLPFPLMLLVS